MAFWTDRADLVEPLRPFRFRIMEAKGYTEFSGSPDDRSYWWWAKSVSKPTYEISKHEYTLINHKFKYPGIASWKDITIKFIDYKDEKHHIPSHVRTIADISGAGDTVVSVAALALVAGLSPKSIAALANLGGGIACESVGVNPISKEQLMEEAQQYLGEDI